MMRSGVVRPAATARGFHNNAGVDRLPFEGLLKKVYGSTSERVNVKRNRVLQHLSTPSRWVTRAVGVPLSAKCFSALRQALSRARTEKLEDVEQGLKR